MRRCSHAVELSERIYLLFRLVVVACWLLCSRSLSAAVSPSLLLKVFELSVRPLIIMAELRRVGRVRARKRVIQFDVSSLTSLHLLEPLLAVLQTVAPRAEEAVVGEEVGQPTLARASVFDVGLVVFGIALDEFIHL